METTTETVRAPRPQKILWQWTGVSAVLHVVVVAALCGVSYLGFAKREAASKAKVEAEETAAKKAEADEAAKATPSPTTATPNTPGEKTASTEKTVATPPPEPAMPAVTAPVQAEKVLGIDQTAKPGDVPKSPFGGSNDDLLKDLK